MCMALLTLWGSEKQMYPALSSYLYRSYLEEHAFLTKPVHRGAAHSALAEGLVSRAIQLISLPLGHNSSQTPERLTAQSVCV